MRTTLEIDDDLLDAARQIAREQGRTVGQVISRLARQSLTTNAPSKVRNGVPVFEQRTVASRPDLRVVNELRDDA
jgi:hypothetical protein